MYANLGWMFSRIWVLREIFFPIDGIQDVDLVKLCLVFDGESSNFAETKISGHKMRFKFDDDFPQKMI